VNSAFSLAISSEDFFGEINDLHIYMQGRDTEIGNVVMNENLVYIELHKLGD
jgi:hypothetical protein